MLVPLLEHLQTVIALDCRCPDAVELEMVLKLLWGHEGPATLSAYSWLVSADL